MADEDLSALLWMHLTCEDKRSLMSVNHRLWRSSTANITQLTLLFYDPLIGRDPHIAWIEGLPPDALMLFKRPLTLSIELQQHCAGQHFKQATMMDIFRMLNQLPGGSIWPRVEHLKFSWGTFTAKVCEALVQISSGLLSEPAEPGSSKRSKKRRKGLRQRGEDQDASLLGLGEPSGTGKIPPPPRNLDSADLRDADLSTRTSGWPRPWCWEALRLNSCALHASFFQLPMIQCLRLLELRNCHGVEKGYDDWTWTCQLTSLRELVLEHGGGMAPPEVMPRSAVDAFTRSLTDLTSLKISEKLTGGSVEALLRGLPHLTSLEVHDLQPSRDLSSFSCALRQLQMHCVRPLHLAHLPLQNLQLPFVLPWLLLGPDGTESSVKAAVRNVLSCPALGAAVKLRLDFAQGWQMGGLMALAPLQDRVQAVVLDGGPVEKSVLSALDLMFGMSVKTVKVQNWSGSVVDHLLQSPLAFPNLEALNFNARTVSRMWLRKDRLKGLVQEREHLRAVDIQLNIFDYLDPLEVDQWDEHGRRRRDPFGDAERKAEGEEIGTGEGHQHEGKVAEEKRRDNVEVDANEDSEEEEEEEEEINPGDYDMDMIVDEAEEYARSVLVPRWRKALGPRVQLKVEISHY